MGFFIRSLIRRKWEGNRRRDQMRLSSQPLPQGVEVRPGIPYLEDGDPMHTLNLYRPAGVSGPLPTIVDIHGGGWMYGDRELNRAYCMYLASQGYAVMGMSYRLVPQTDISGQIRDVFASLEWLAAHGAEYGFDLSKLLLTGDSAGGHLAALTACVQLDPKLQKLYRVSPLPLRITALAIAHGVCDVYRFRLFTPLTDRAVTREYLDLMLGRPWQSSPLRGHVSFADTAPGLPLPPILVISSEADRYYAQSQHLIRCLEHSAIPHELIHWSREKSPRTTHVFEVGWWDWDESRETNDRMLDFFRRQIEVKVKSHKQP